MKAHGPLLGRLAFAVVFCLGLLAYRPDATAQRVGGNKPKTQEEIVESFKKCVADFIRGYGSPDFVSLYGDVKGVNGWKHEQYEIEPGYTIDVQTTTSLVTPYIGILVFDLKSRDTDMHQSQSNAENDTVFKSTISFKHKHTYGFQDGQWVLTTRKTYSIITEKYSDCFPSGHCCIDWVSNLSEPGRKLIRLDNRRK